MTKTNVANVEVGDIDANPYRNIESYPLDQKKLDQLCISYDKAGMWEGVIGRRVGNRVQLAFGHHRLEAAKLSGLKSISVILKPLSDEQMLLYMGLENLEEYNSTFTVLLETWEAAVKFSAKTGKHGKTDIARLLGWLRKDGKKTNNTADACSGALELIEKGWKTRADFAGLRVTPALEIIKAERTAHKAADAHAPEEAEERHKLASLAGTNAARKSVEGSLSDSDAAVETYTASRPEPDRTRPIPDFFNWSQALIRRLDAMLDGDAQERDIARLIESQAFLDDEEEISQINGIRMAVGQLADRAEALSKKIHAPVSKPKLKEIA